MALDELRMMSIGLIGAGFSYRAFQNGLKMGPHVVASDAGSSDGGPLYLGSGRTGNSRAAIKRDLDVLITGARSIKVPFIIGSAGTAGGDAQLATVRQIVEEIAKERGLHFRVAFLHAEQTKAYVLQKLKERKIVPHGAYPELTPEEVEASTHIVGMMGVEPFVAALDAGADVIIGGRSADPCIFAGFPLRAGFPEGNAWHAARTMDKGPLMTDRVQEHSMGFIHLRRDHFIASPTKEGVRCTPRTVAGIALYENDSPYFTKLPSGTIDTRECRFEAVTDSTVRVSGGRFIPAQKYTIKLEGAKPIGYRALGIMAIRDSVLIKHLDPWLDDVRSTAERNLHLGGIEKSQFTVRFRVYGKNGVMGANEPVKETKSHEVCVLIEAVAKSQDIALAAAGRHGAVAHHVNFPGRLTTAGNTSAPFPGGPVPMGEVYDWNVWHIVEPKNWQEMASVEIVNL